MTAFDPRIVHGARCTWWDGIAGAGHILSPSGHRLPACPHCGSVLFEHADEETWWKMVDKYEAKGHPRYRKLVEWSRGKCFKTHAEAVVAYNLEHSGAPYDPRWFPAEEPKS